MMKINVYIGNNNSVYLIFDSKYANKDKKKN